MKMRDNVSEYMMKLLKTVILTALLFVVGQIETVAQEARPARSGIYIDLGKALPRQFSYKISRKVVDSTAWTELSTLRFQKDSAVFFSLLVQAGAKYPTFRMPEQRFYSNIWKLIITANTTDSVTFYGSTPAFKEAMGTAYYDQTARPNVKYEYRIESVANGNMPAAGQSVVQASYPQIPETDYQLATQHIEPFNQNQVLKYYSKGRVQPAGIVLMRQVYMQTEFEPAPAYTGITLKGDSNIYMAVDTVLKQGLVYQYVAIPFDDLGNPGRPSDTVRISNTTFNNTPMVVSVKTTSMEKENAIRLNWKLNKTTNVSTINVYRSESYDGAGYVHIATLSAQDTVYMDHKVHPVKNYYYSLQPVTIYGSGIQSVRFSGMLKANKKALAPKEISAYAENGVLKLSWNRPEYYTRGYYIYRRKSGTDSLAQISNLIVTDSLHVTWADTIQMAQNAQTYAYAVKAVNTSYDISDFSNIVDVSTPVLTKLSTPLNVRARGMEAGVMVFWDNKTENTTGYNVYRRPKNPEPSGEYTLLNVKPLHFSDNYYEDKTITPGQSYEYAVQAISVNTQLSALSAAASAGLNESRILPVGGIQVRLKDGQPALSWDTTDQSTVVEYKVYRLKEGGRELLATIPKNAAGYIDENPKEKSLNSYVVTCAAKNMESEQSTTVSIRLK